MTLSPNELSPNLPIIEGTSGILSSASPNEGQSGCACVQWIGRAWTWIKEKILEPIAQFFYNIFCCCCEPAIPISIDPQIRTRILPYPEELFRADASVLSKPIVNLSSTCYMNSALQLIASSNGFNDFFETEIPCPIRESFRNDQAFQRAAIIHENNCLLQGHLAAIINRLRDPDSALAVSKDHLQTLFHLLQVCGWRKQPWHQQDPQEFLGFLRDKFNVLGKLVTSSRISYSADGEIKVNRLGEASPNFEMGIELPINAEKQITGPAKDMNTLVQNANTVSIEYRPEGSPTNIGAEKETLFIAPAPDTLCIHELRFGYTPDGRTFRKSAAIPTEPTFNPILTIPVIELDQNKDPIAEPLLKKYKLISAICHSGGTSISSGHYTMFRLQNIGNKLTWVYYNDSRTLKYYPQKDDITNEIPQIVSNTIKLCGYYLVYEAYLEETTAPAPLKNANEFDSSDIKLTEIN